MRAVQGWQRKGSSEASAFHKPLGVGRTGWQPVLLGKPSVVQRAACPLEGVCAKHSANGKPNASPWVRDRARTAKLFALGPFSKQRLYQIRGLLRGATGGRQVGETLYCPTLRPPYPARRDASPHLAAVAGRLAPPFPPHFTISQWPHLELPTRLISDFLVNALR